MKANLIIGIMYAEKNKKFLPKVIEKLENKFGKILFESQEVDFNFTKYYEKEFGENLKKIFYLFSNLNPEELPDIKLFAREIEKETGIKEEFGEKRIFNIDPGYITKNSIILASIKPRPHRIYLSKGIYADLQMVYENKEWKTFRWTFPDMIVFKDFFEKARSLVKE